MRKLKFGRRWGAGLMPLASRTSHTRVHLGHASLSGMACLVQCVQRNQISLRDKQLASINTVYIFLYIYLQLYINFPKTLSHTHIFPSLSNSSPHNYPTTTHIQHANQTSLTIRRLADPLSIIFLGHGDLAPPWLQLLMPRTMRFSIIFGACDIAVCSVLLRFRWNTHRQWPHYYNDDVLKRNSEAAYMFKVYTSD